MIVGRVSRGPRSISGQIVMLLILVVSLFQLATAALFTLMTDGRTAAEPSGVSGAGRFADFVRVIDKLPSAARADVIESMRAAVPGLGLRLLASNDECATQASAADSTKQRTTGNNRAVEYVARYLRPSLAPFVLTCRGEAPPPEDRHAVVAVAVRLHDNAVVAGTILDGGPQEPTPLGMLLLTLAMIVTISEPLLWWAARSLTAPLRQFALAAEAFSANRDPAPLPEIQGPDEVRTASLALNQMQARVRKMIEDRMRMLAAVSHDLRTPITRIRLRAELMASSEARSQMLRDLDQMDGMVQAALSYLREGQNSNSPVLIDLASLLQLVCNDFADLEADVRYDGPARLLVRAHNDELQRAVTNLVDNALKHGGGCAKVRVTAISHAEIAIDVIDAGPGISEELKEAMLAPFVRGEASAGARDRSSGFGLGLAIAHSVAELHGGKLILMDATPSGLVARLVLPIRETAS